MAIIVTCRASLHLLRGFDAAVFRRSLENSAAQGDSRPQGHFSGPSAWQFGAALNHEFGRRPVERASKRHGVLSVLRVRSPSVSLVAYYYIIYA